MQLEGLHRKIVAEAPSIIAEAIIDLEAVHSRDPAADGFLTPFLYYKGFHALQWYRVGHWLWNNRRRHLARFLQSRVSQALAIDIHPAARIGHGVFIDHGTGVVIGETSVVGNNVSMLHEVTLGGTGKETGDRHPKVGDGVLLSAGAKILGNIEIGRASKVGAGSVVLKNVGARTTVAGVPARMVAADRHAVPALDMDQTLPRLDYCI
jgi:serine O-acetyltransferase